MKQDFYHMRCVSCGRKYSEEQAYTKCPRCGDSLDVVYDYDFILERLNRYVLKSAPMSVMKYIDFYPLKDLRQLVSLFEGGTPLYKAKNITRNKGLYIKNEGLNPTGAFKDRGSVIEIAKAVEMNKHSICCASTGNMAASVSAYSSKANIPCYVVIPEGTPLGKMSQTLSYGSRVIQIRGTYDDASRLTEEIADKHGFYLAGDYAFRAEGQKSCAYEILEQLNWSSPDKVIVPIGCGTNISAIWKGFKEFMELDFVDSLPQMIGVQGRNSSPIVEAFRRKLKRWRPVRNPETVATAMMVGDPLDGTKVLKTLKESSGNAVSVSDEDILEAEKLLAKKESVFVEPSAAATLSAYSQMLDSGDISRDDKVVLVLTGAGLKDPVAALRVLPQPPSVDPSLKDISRFLDYGYYNVHAYAASKPVELFSREPTAPKLRSVIRREFDLKLNDSDIGLAMEKLRAFLRKGKKLTKLDLKYILEEILTLPVIKKKALDIVDYEVSLTKSGEANAFIKAKFLNSLVEETSSGVGPFDAIISAVRKLINGSSLHVKLIDYSVNINSKGTDAVVDVHLTLQDNEKNKVITIGTSPDIIQASVKAFEDGYNILYAKHIKEER